MMSRKARVAPESSLSEEIKSAKSSNSLLAFENPELSSAITGKVIETNDNTNENLRISKNNTNEKSKKNVGKPHKRIARSVSEVVEEKEKQERNVFSRFAHNYRRNGVYGIFLAVVDEVDLFKYRCSKCSKYLLNKVTCAKHIEED